MKKQIFIQRFGLFFILCFCFMVANAQKKQQNFLFVGNSFTMRHELPTIFANISNEGNPESLVETEILGYGGKNLFHHWECFRSYDRIVINKLSQTDFDNTKRELEKFNKALRQFRKLTDELQDIVMSIRMVPISSTFQKMRRIVRDMGKKLSKDVDLVLMGEATEVDKTIIDGIADPLLQ